MRAVWEVAAVEGDARAQRQELNRRVVHFRGIGEVAVAHGQSDKVELCDKVIERIDARLRQFCPPTHLPRAISPSPEADLAQLT